MKRLYFLFTSLVLFSLAGCSIFKSSNSPVKLKVLSYNIHHANPPSKPGVIDLNAIAAVIRKTGADVVGLQEVDVRTSRSGSNLDQAAELGRLTGMHHYFVKGIDYAGGEYGIAILSKYPFLKADSLRLPMDPQAGGEPRVMAFVQIEPKKGRQITFANTHLELKKENRILQTKAVVDKLGEETGPVIFCGDLNAKPDSDVIELFDKHFIRSKIANGFTFPEVNPRSEIDYIMYKPAERLRVIKHEVVDEPYASDHRPLLVEFEIK